MISLREFIDGYEAARRATEPAAPAGQAVKLRSNDQGENAHVSACQAVLRSISEEGQRAIPALASELQTRMSGVAARLAGKHSSDAVAASASEAVHVLRWWADAAVKLQHDGEQEIREIIEGVTRTASAISNREDNYGREMSALTGKLQKVAVMTDLASVRRSVVESTAALKACVERMAEESRACVRQLTAEVEQYRTKLEESERLAAIDPVTQLANRLYFERHLNARTRGMSEFTLMLIDLNHFKEINDSHGHVVGDEVLRNFAAELRSQFTALDLVSRWGGDEFAVIIAGDEKEARLRADRVRRWAMGEYRVNGATENVKVQVTASIGYAQWDGVEPGLQLITRADERLYREKAARALAGSTN
jgi:diguanylate cyclase